MLRLNIPKHERGQLPFAGIYARITDLGDRGRVRESKKLLMKSLEAYCGVRPFVVVESYFDVVLAGDRSRGPELARAVLDSVQGRIDRIVVLRLDQFCETPDELLPLWRLLDAHDVGIVSVRDSLDTGTPIGKLWMEHVADGLSLKREWVGEIIELAAHAA